MNNTEKQFNGTRCPNQSDNGRESGFITALDECGVPQPLFEYRVGWFERHDRFSITDRDLARIELVARELATKSYASNVRIQSRPVVKWSEYRLVKP